LLIFCSVSFVLSFLKSWRKRKTFNRAIPLY
jgi:hypothetical protein